MARVPGVVAVCGEQGVLGGLEGGGDGKRVAISALCEPGHQNMSVALTPRLLGPFHHSVPGASPDQHIT